MYILYICMFLRKVCGELGVCVMCGIMCECVYVQCVVYWCVKGVCVCVCGAYTCVCTCGMCVSGACTCMYACGLGVGTRMLLVPGN